MPINNKILFKSEGDMTKWEEYCLPIGNGYMGASFFGGVKKERIVLNEKTLWAGGPSPNRPDYNGGNRENAYKSVKKVQELLYDNKYEEALSYLPDLTCTTTGEGYGSYLLLCDAVLDFSDISDNVTDYSRQLDLDKSLYCCSFICDGVRYEREAFASYPDRVIVMRFRANEKGKVSFRIAIDKAHDESTVKAEGNRLDYFGALVDNGLRYHAAFQVKTEGGKVSADGSTLSVAEADEALIYFTCATDYEDNYPVYRTGEDPVITVNNILNSVVTRAFDELYEVHIADYSVLFNRVKLTLNDYDGDIPAIEDLMKEYKEEHSEKALSYLEPLYFQFGRYMLISSSRTGSLPANLQGVWNESNCPPWCCDYHINVNLQMNYWGAYNTNLSETVEPLVRFLDKMREPGRITAECYYNIKSDENNPENGWIAHTQSTPFGWTSPGWDFYWGWSTAAVAWLMQNIWEYYEFTLDKDFLRERIYPIMKESAMFYKQWLIYDDKQERLVSTPTYSPEHGPVTIGNTYEQCLIDQFYADFIKASEILGVDEDLRNEINEQKKLLKPYHIGRRGQLKEWFEEEDDSFDNTKTQPFHRHISHLLGLYPGKSISDNTPELIEAAKVTLNERGDDSTGWARAYKLNLWARIKDGNRSYKILKGLLDGCTFPNLFDFHPPFQLDGNFGGSAGIAEMLLQSHDGVIVPLASVPDVWKNGSYEGLCARDGFEVSVYWRDNIIKSIVIKSLCGMRCRIKTAITVVTCNGAEIDSVYDNGVISFDTEEGKVYTIAV